MSDEVRWRVNDELPENLEHLESGLLSWIISKRNPGVRVAAARLLNVHKGVCNHLKFEVDYECNPDGGFSNFLFVKTNIGSSHAALIASLGLAESEVGFYSELAVDSQLPIPRTLGAVLDPEGRFVLVQEDVIAAGSTLGSCLSPLTCTAAEQVLSEIAKFHAAFWDSPKLRKISWLQSWTEGPMADRRKHETTFEPVAGSPAIGEIFGRLTDYPAVHQARARLRLLNDREPRTLSHGDLHAENIIFDRERPLFTDFQLLRKSSWAADVGYFICSAFEPCDRRQWEEDLLRHYLTELQRAGIHAPGFAEAWDLYRAQPIYGFTAFFRVSEAMHPAITIRTFVSRFATAAEDLDSMNVLGHLVS
jgi:hypothetical protein